MESEILEKRRGGLNDGLEVEEGAPTGRFYWDQGPRVDAFGGDLSIIVGGRLQVDGAAFGGDDEITDTFGDPDPGFEVRRAFIELGALYRERYEFRFMLDLNDPVDFRDVFVGALTLSHRSGIRVGYFKEPFGLEEIESSNDITLMERSLTDALVERRNLGVMLHHMTETRRSTAALGVYRDANNELDVGDGYGVTGRITGLPLDRDGGRQLIHLGAAATYRVPSDDTLRFRSRPESQQAQVLVDTGPFAATRDIRFGLEAATALGPLSFQTEFMLAAAQGTAVGDPLFPSFYFMGSYILTGERRLYRKNVGAFGRVFPERRTGAWELVGRYSYLDLDSEGIQGGVLHDWTLGLNWYQTSYSRLMFNYIAAHPEGFGVEHIAQVRLQVNL